MDETNCTCTNTTQWRCPRSDKCISISYICDGTEECLQGEDEENCPTILPTTIASSVPSISTTAQPVTRFTSTPVASTPLVCVRGNDSYRVSIKIIRVFARQSYRKLRKLLPSEFPPRATYWF